MTRRKRKTFKITELIKMVNRMNEESTCSPEIRIGWNCFVEGILMETKTYEGYNFARNAFDPQTGEIIDDTRRMYCETRTNSHRTEWDHTWINEGFLTQ
tara:strand:+ start:640 stop:936 length:297 start_codon:yes stop_codon:yes gene_type:complete